MYAFPLLPYITYEQKKTWKRTNTLTLRTQSTKNSYYND